MFRKFFGLKDDPFKLACDGAYLFTGRHHEEALAHLRYAVAEGEGFTVITGERGVGKSTVCRAFVDGMGAGAPSAFLAGPVATPKELMRRINAEFGIDAAAETIKELIDALNVFLMDQRRSRRKAAVFIDDAQTLPPDILEQVRLLSNLETTREKLIQIVLIGEPELMRVLDSHALRQMGQRVSVCYELGPLSEDETAAYIQHRLSLSAQGPPLRFDPGAVRHIFRWSGGNPRRVNLAGAAVLSAAFKARQKHITSGLARAAVDALGPGNGAEASDLRPRGRRRWVLAACGLAAAAAAAFTLLQPVIQPPMDRTASEPPAASLGEPPPAAPVAADIGSGAAPVPVSPNLPPAAAPTAGPQAEPARAAQTTPAYSVQVGAFLHLENAEQMVRDLTAKGYPAGIFAASDGKGRYWHTVRIGDFTSRKEAQQKADEFSRRESAKCVIRPYGTL